MRLLTATIAFVLALAWPGYSRAATYVVTSAADTHDLVPGDGKVGNPSLPDSVTCSFRAAIEEVNAGSGYDTIQFSIGVRTCYLSLGAIDLTARGTRVVGNGAILDGLHDPSYANLLTLRSDSNQIVGLTLQRARFHALEIRGGGNRIGDSTGQVATLFLNNGIDRGTTAGIYMAGADATGNQVTGCWIGLSVRNEACPNQYGVILDSSCSNNLIGTGSPTGRAIISSNIFAGVLITHGSSANQITNCTIGPDASILLGSGNGNSGVALESGAHDNRVGPGNFISKNAGAGVALSGSGTTRNRIVGNIIGLDYSGIVGIGNRLGVSITGGAFGNTVGGNTVAERNVISGNDSDGVRITGYGTFANMIYGNFIGTDTGGYFDLGNGQLGGAGLFIGDGAGGNLVGSASPNTGNVISGNPHGGVCISGAHDNTVSGNLIGVSIESISSSPNGNGVQLLNGASNNLIGGTTPGSGNVISGNRADIFPNGAGVQILGEGTSRNTIVGNMIGTDITGSRALRNGSAGVLIGDGASHNQIGGSSSAERNVISGNGSGSYGVSVGAGVHLFGAGTAYNVIQGNYIGVGVNGIDRILNQGNGIGMYAGAHDNLIGGDTVSEGNLISRNPLHGIYVADAGSTGNSLLSNAIYANDSAGIRVRVTTVPSPPQLQFAAAGEVHGITVARGEIQLFRAAPDKSGRGEGKSLLAECLADSTGYFSVASESLVSGDTLTATVTDSAGSTSEFAQNIVVDAPTGVDEEPIIPLAFALEQNYPNPFNPSTTITFFLPHSGFARLSIYNLQGQQVRVVQSGIVRAGVHVFNWDGCDATGAPVASGVYFYRLVTDDRSVARKMVLLK